MTLISSSCKSTNLGPILFFNKSYEFLRKLINPFFNKCIITEFEFSSCFSATTKLFNISRYFISIGYDDYKIIATYVINAKDSHNIVGIYYVKNES
ncbi:hypothetical protein H5410_005446 [Solanum commersonii]|uniref:Uncharacterized protein n=1 Tax=Solanum commersonii TaxID=4109 RepID=A0A9J6A7K9_SOLCO|nr:hypothetical protein H5410_005446 [Solanum commersonii]